MDQSGKNVEKQLFGTNGVRGITGQGMTPDLVLAIGMALGSMRQGTVAVGRDSRTSGPALISAIKAGLMATGCDVIDCGILPTPALQYIVRNHFDAGAVITASHNPPEYNGVKVIEADGTEMDDHEAVLLEKRIFSRSFSLKDWEGVGTEKVAPLLVDEYVSSIADHFPGLPGKGMTVAVDTGSGAACSTTPAILSRLGCRVVSLNAQPDGRFPGRLPEPSTEGLSALATLVTETGAAFGIAHDGDADRAVFIDETGQYLEENKEFALIADMVCTGKRGVIVTPVSTSSLIEKIARRHDCSVDYTPVGSIYVARRMIALISAKEKVVFGGEGNGGLIFPDHQFCRDGGMTAAMMVSLLAGTGKSLSDLVKALPPSVMIKEKVHTSRAQEMIQALKSEYSALPSTTIDGIRVTRGPAWALVRPSGTEPFVRVMVEAESENEAQQFYSEIRRIIDPFIAP